MAISYKVLGQSAPAANIFTTLYTVPVGASAIVSTLHICNQTTSTQTFRALVRPSGVATATQHFLAFDTPVVANDAISLTIGVTMAATDIITIYASTSSMSFNLFGSEVS